MWYFILPVIIISQQKKAQRRRQMGPRLKVSNDVFIHEVSHSSGKVIRGPKVLWQGYTYLVCGGEYYYYTISKEPLVMPPDIEVIDVKQILL